MIRLGLTYGTSPDQLNRGMEILKEIVADHQNMVTDTPVVFLENFGDFALVILFIYYIRKEADIPETQSTINLEILQRFEQEGLDFAFPTQTIYNVNK